MTIDDLRKIFDAAYAARDNDGSPATEGGCRCAGIRAVVMALRDETAISSCACKFWLDDILGDAGEKLPDYIRTDNRVVIDPGTAYCAPATDAAPAVCVWTHKESWIGEGVAGEAGCDGERRFRRRKRNCPSCGKPIKFTEAK